MNQQKKQQFDFSQRLKSEKIFMQDFIERNLSRTAEMFSYGGMPEEIPIFIYERMLQKSGWVCVFEYEGKLYVQPCAIYGELNEYYMPKQVIVVNPYLGKGGFERVFTVGVDCEVILSDSGMQGLLPIFEKYGLMTRTAELTLDTLAYLARIPFLITAKDGNQKDGAEAFLKKVLDGDYGVIAGNEFFDSIRTDITHKGERTIADVVEFANYANSRFFNEIGILADYNGMKKERTGGADTQFATPSLIPFVENMLNERKQGWERVNKLFGTNVEVDFNSVWQLNGAFMKSATETYLANGLSEEVDIIDEKGASDELDGKEGEEGANQKSDEKGDDKSSDTTAEKKAGEEAEKVEGGDDDKTDD